MRIYEECSRSSKSLQWLLLRYIQENVVVQCISAWEEGRKRKHNLCIDAYFGKKEQSKHVLNQMFFKFRFDMLFIVHALIISSLFSFFFLKFLRILKNMFGSCMCYLQRKL